MLQYVTMLINANRVLEGGKRLGLAFSCSPKALVQGNQKGLMCHNVDQCEPRA